MDLAAGSEHRPPIADLVVRLLSDIQNRGQLAAGVTTYDPDARHLLRTHKDLGSVRDVFCLNHAGKHRSVMAPLSGTAAIGHTRYSTSGADDIDYAQPLERQHGRPFKWFSFAFNGNVANHPELATHLSDRLGYHLLRPDCDSELFMHSIAFHQQGSRPKPWPVVFAQLAETIDGAWSLALLTADGHLVVARDPLGVKPLCWGRLDSLVVAASESIALQNLGVPDIRDVPPGHLLHAHDGQVELVPYIAEIPRPRHCFFEWIYFANAASKMDGCSVYRARCASGRTLARQERITPGPDHVVVPVPDTSKPAGDAFAFELGIPSVEGLLRNRYAGDRTFIESGNRRDKVARKFVVLRDVLEAKKVFLVDDSLVRSTTMNYLIEYLRGEGHAAEVHVRFASPPILAPCFYGIDMSTIGELFAPRFLSRVEGSCPVLWQAEEEMAAILGADSLRYLPVGEMGACIGLPQEQLCLACVTADYPTTAGQNLYELARADVAAGRTETRASARRSTDSG